MPLLPIDLQTLFAQQTQVAKEQAVQKEAVPHAQSLQAAHLVQKAAARDTAVTEARQADEGPEQVKERSGRQGKRREKPPAPPEKRPPVGGEVVRDPALGRNVDLTG
jgi:hypothetical protein